MPADMLKYHWKKTRYTLKHGWILSMRRLQTDHLVQWMSRPTRKPLIVRGARQVGKSYLVRTLARDHFENLVELNFERDAALDAMFTSNEPAQILRLLELHAETRIVPGQTLLFLDEIQAGPAALSALRYFHEELPQLHVIAAGSLLEIVLNQKRLAVPVGRLEYMYMGPMQFEEFLMALGHDRTVSALQTCDLRQPLPHEKLLSLLRSYVAVGGMPEAVQAFVSSGSFHDVEIIQQSILATYSDDFSKYSQRVSHHRLLQLFTSLPCLVGCRFKYVLVNRHQRSKDIAEALDLLCQARVAYRVLHSAGMGVPLAAQTNDRKFKVLFLDLGLMIRSLGLNLLTLSKQQDLFLANAGAVSEQLIGQHLLYSLKPYEEPQLHFWTREQKNAAAELDYLIAQGPNVIGVEVKAGKSGTLKSLHMFLKERKLKLGVRFNTQPPSLFEEQASMQGQSVHYKLLSLPFYLVGQARRLIDLVGT